jgi:protein HIRA/HIR1
VRIVDDHFARSDFSPALAPSGANASDIVLASLEATIRSTSGASLAPNGAISDHFQEMETLAHIETQLAAAIAVHSQLEFRHWLSTYVRRLVRDSKRAKLIELCNQLLCTSSSSSSPSSLSLASSSPTILGLDKRELLRLFVLPLIGKNRALQRLVSQFTELLND